MNDQQTNQPYTPTGFCVRCLYPGTPGEICSECGGRMVDRESGKGLSRMTRMSPGKWFAYWIAIAVGHKVVSYILVIVSMPGGFMPDFPLTHRQQMQGAVGLFLFRMLNPHSMLPRSWLRLRSELTQDFVGTWTVEFAESLLYSALLLFLFSRLRAWRFRRLICQLDRNHEA